MNQLAYEPSSHPGNLFAPSSIDFNGLAHNPQGYPQTRLPQSKQAFAYPSQQRAYHDEASSDFQQPPRGGGGMMHMQPSFATPPANNSYTSVPYTQSVPPQTLPAASPIPEQALNARQSVTPPQRFSPNAVSQRQSSSHTPPTRYPMAAPPLPQPQADHQEQQVVANAGTAPAVTSPRTPQSPGSQSREQSRITLLLDINIELLAEVNRLQSFGQGGAISAQQAAQLKTAGKSDKMASDEYIHCLRRVQANLAYMMPKAQPHASNQNEAKVPPGPALLTPPGHMPQLKEKYEQLKELFPDWQGIDHRLSQGSGANLPSPRSGVQAGGLNGLNSQNAMANAMQ